MLGKKLQFSENELNELEQAGYYHNIGVINLLKKDMLSKDFKKKRGEEGYTHILKELKLSENIAITAKLYLNNYECMNFELHKAKQKIPYYQIVSLAHYYYNSSKYMPKEYVIQSILRLGSKKFNTFILHKFVDLLKNERT